ncbi:MAG: hypothetical protein ACP5QR_16310 [Rhizomicrobium sp.]
MYDAVPDPYRYAGTTILKNRAEIIDQSALEEFEAAMVAQRAMNSYQLAGWARRTTELFIITCSTTFMPGPAGIVTHGSRRMEAPSVIPNI